MENKEEKLVFIHITKTGGSSFRQLLSRNLGNAFFVQPSLIWEKPLSGEQVETLFRTYDYVSALASHRLSIDLPFQSSAFQLKAITFVRDPVDRFLSHYFFHRNNMPGHENTRAMDLDEFIRYGLEDRNESWLIDGQLKFLTNYREGASIEEIQEWVERDQLYLLPLAAFDEACLVLEKELPRFFRDASYVRQNVSIRDQDVSPEQRARIGSHMEKDYLLLDLAQGQLRRLKRKHHPDPASFDRAAKHFRRRCVLRLYLMWHPRKLAGRVLRRLRIIR